jgi:hypothetical protein
MGKYASWLITEIEFQMENRLSEESRQALLDEVTSHLDAAIRARLELGMEPIQAEREAVELFGRPEAYVNELLAIHEGASPSSAVKWFWLAGDRRTILTLWLGSICATGTTFLEHGNLHSPFLLLVGVGTAWFLGKYSYRTRRLQLLPIAISTLGIYSVWSAVTMLMWGYPSLDTAFDLIYHTAFVIPLFFAFAAAINILCGGIGWLNCQPEFKRLRERIR